jgi:hypothetical protein
MGMQYPGFELPRIPIPRTRVNKGKKKGRSVMLHPCASVRSRERR